MGERRAGEAARGEEQGAGPGASSEGARSEARLGDEHPPRVAPASSGRREERRSQRPAAARAEQRDGEQHRDGTSKRRPADGRGERHRDGASKRRGRGGPRLIRRTAGASGTGTGRTCSAEQDVPMRKKKVHPMTCGSHG